MGAKIFIATAANGGDDGNNGLTTGAPKLTFRNALNTVNESGTIEIIDSAVHFPSHNFDNRAVVPHAVNIHAAEGQTPILDGSQAASANEEGFAVNTRGFIDFKGIKFQNFGGNSNNQIVRQAKFATVRYTDCVFTNMSNAISLFHQPASGSPAETNMLDRCRIERTVSSSLFNDPGQSSGQWNFLLQNSVFEYQNGTISGNYVDAGGDNYIGGIVRNCSFLVGLSGSDTTLIRAGVVENTIVRNTASNAVHSTDNHKAIRARTEYSNNCVFGNFGTTEVDTTSVGATNGGGLVTLNPLFVDESSTDTNPPDLQLQGDSPCIDAGKTIAAVTVDFLGVARPQSTAYDIGAFENVYWMSADNSEGNETKFGPNNFEIRTTKRKLASRVFPAASDNRQAPYFITIPGPVNIRGRTTPYKNET